MPRKVNYVGNLVQISKSKRSLGGPIELDLLCTSVYHYLGEEIVGAMHGMFLSVIAQSQVEEDVMQTSVYSSWEYGGYFGQIDYFHPAQHVEKPVRGVVGDEDFQSIAS